MHKEKEVCIIMEQNEIDPFYSQNNMKYLEEVISDIETGRAKIEEHELIKEE